MKVNLELRSRRCKNTKMQKTNITKMREYLKQKKRNSRDSNSSTDFKHDNGITIPFDHHPSLKRMKASTMTLPSIEKLQIARRSSVLVMPWPSRKDEEHSNVPKALSGATGSSCKAILGGTTTTTTTKLFWPEQREMQSQMRSSHHEQPLNGEVVLRGGNESLPVEMSGAMQPPIVTVDDINVPVFIDEYPQLTAQEITDETGTTGSLASFIGSNTMCCDNNSNNIEGEMLKNLEFDFEMFAKEEKEEIVKSNNHMAGGTMMMKKSNNYDMNTSICVENNTYNINIDNKQNACSINNKSNIDMMTIEKRDEDYYTQCLISSDIEVNEHLDNIDLCLDMNDDIYIEEAVNLSAINNDNNSFSEVFCYPQSTDTHTLFSDCLGGIPFSEELDDAKPVIPNIDYDAEYEMCINQQPCKSGDETANKCTFHDEIEVVVGPPPLEVTNERTTTSLLRKPLSPTSSRSSSPTSTSTSTSFSATRANRSSSYYNNRKHLKLQLKDSRLQSLDNSDSNTNGGGDTVTTPYVINLLSNWGKEGGGMEYNPFTNSTAEDIRRDLLTISRLTPPPESASPMTNGTRKNGDDDWWIPSTMATSNCPSSVATDSPQSITSSFSTIAEDDTIPPTPQSYSSSYYQTTSPNSPALSSTTTVTTSTAKSTKSTRKRGRPSKEHSDWPDQSQLQDLSDVDRKRLQDRAKNNEASRLSRLKNKQRGESEIKEEEQLICKNIELKAELKRLNRIVTKLRRALQRCHFIVREGETMKSS